MRRVLVTNVAILLTAFVAFYFYRQHKNVQNDTLVRALTPELVQGSVAVAAELIMYRGAGTRLWSDRDYSTEKEVKPLMGLSFLRLPRNSSSPYTLHVSEPTIIYTIANGSDRSSTEGGWDELGSEVFVDDAYPPRRFDQLLSKALQPGNYVVTHKHGGPAQPVFFNKEHVRVE